MLPAVLAAAALLATTLPVSAQERMPPIPAAQLTDAQKTALAAFTAARGGAAPAGGPFQVMLRSPEVMERARAMGDYLRFRTALPPRLSEFVILITAHEWSQAYEWNVHYPIAVKEGVSEAVARAIAEGRRPDTMSTEETVLYDFCSELLRNKAVSDPAYARAVAAFGEKGVIDTIGIVGYYSLLGMMLNVARTDPGVPAAVPLQR
jgi:4-carboxymuconolactone decarboxylase